MFGWILGAVSLGALFAVLKRRRHRYLAYYGGACGSHGAWADSRRSGWHDPDWRGRWHAHAHAHARGSRHGLLRGLFMQLDTTPGQEKAIVHELADARERLRSFKLDVEEARRDIAAIIASDVFDQAALEQLLAERRATLDSMSKELVRTLATVHEVLDTRQRRELGELLADGSIGQALRPRDAWF
ncbi:MAG: uncharacterized protein JWN48_3809 [Myxococcaceae bacterium]|nr:uncharacterized protein [Myxococcaceae bacterium]